MIYLLLSSVIRTTTTGGFQIMCVNVDKLIDLGSNDTSTLVGNFVSSLREREKRDRIDSRGDEREGQGRKRNNNESEKKRNKNIPPLPLPATKIAGLVELSQYQLDALMT